MLLTKDELPNYYPEAAVLQPNDITKYLLRANAYCLGYIGGVPAYTAEYPAEPVKAAVALAFEVFAEGQIAQTDNVNGNITEAAPVGFYVRKADNPLEVVNQMLQAYANRYKSTQEAANADNGVRFL